MGPVLDLPVRGELFVDERGVVLRASAHTEHSCVVLSVWHGDTCAASFRLPLAESARLATFLLGPPPESPATGPPPASRAPRSGERSPL